MSGLADAAVKQSRPSRQRDLIASHVEMARPDSFKPEQRLQERP
jgi:hypothetical protein